MINTPVVDNLNQQLEQLVTLACSYPVKSLQRRQKLNELVRLVMRSGKLWKENTPYYNDALQQTWLYFCRNLEEYNHERGSVITISLVFLITGIFKPNRLAQLALGQLNLL